MCEHDEDKGRAQCWLQILLVLCTSTMAHIQNYSHFSTKYQAL